MAEKGLVVTKITPIPYDGDVYNLHIEDNHNYFANGILVSNCHQGKARALTSILEKMIDVQYRIGTTGSLDDKKVHHLTLEGLFGRVHRVATTKKLQDEGKLVGLDITALLLKYPAEIKKANCKLEYQDEINFLISNERRNKFISNLSINCRGNTLILFQYVEKHGAVLYELIKNKAGDRPVYFIHGDVDAVERENIRDALSNQNNAIVIASIGTTSTGVNIPSIENIIFASPTKSVIRVLQSIGRGLRLNTGKSECKLFDITDDLSHKNHKNHTLKHGAERYKIYSQEEFKIKLVEIKIE